ncbi:MAG: hypothetical protein GY953_40905 [bacterium]|nr:hypothetical protein [bacterium]
MSVLNPRNRLVNFRLSEVEFEKLKASCARQGARSISDFARTSVLGNLDEPIEGHSQSNGRLSNLDQKVSELEIRVDQLLHLMSAAGRPALSPPAHVPLARDSGDLQQY